jgi:hypothetical protein
MDQNEINPATVNVDLQYQISSTSGDYFFEMKLVHFKEKCVKKLYTFVV